MTAEALCGLLGISQPTLSREIAAAGAGILRLGRARATRYAAARSIPAIGGEFPVYTVDATGAQRKVATLFALARGQFWLQPAEGRGTAFDDLPWFMQDMRPQGFLGRAFAKTHPALQLPARLDDWNSDHTLAALVLAGEDRIGNVVVGRTSMDRFLATHEGPVSDDDIVAAYPRLAQQAIDGDPAGSSAGGEQPKFELARQGAGGPFHAIVKFSPPTALPEGTRWADLLRAEHHAAATLARHGTDAARTRIFAFGDRVFLEVRRFDRVGERGRRGVVSLGSACDEFAAGRDRYSLAGERLVHQRLLNPQDAARLAFIEAFGMMIANSDMHFGNVSLACDEPLDPRLEIAPVYDMLPMRYRPTPEAAQPDPGVANPVPTESLLEAWPAARLAAIEYWGTVAGDEAISPGFRSIATANGQALRVGWRGDANRDDRYPPLRTN